MLDLKNEVKSLRRLIRTHRDQVGDFRCWVDDEVLYHSVLPELKGIRPEVPKAATFTAYCERYFEHRQDPNNLGSKDIPLDSKGTPLTLSYSATLDTDVETMGTEELQKEIARLLSAVRTHRAPGQLARTYHDDQRMYLELPEKVLATTRLPSRDLFLGRGCPNYNQHCQDHPEDFAEGQWNVQNKE